MEPIEAIKQFVENVVELFRHELTQADCTLAGPGD
jgi:hypothetical protein